MTRSVSRPIETSTRSSPPREFDPTAIAPEPPPCAGCQYAITCRTRQLACKAFAQYTKSGRWKPRVTLRLPSRRPYLRLFRQ